MAQNSAKASSSVVTGTGDMLKSVYDTDNDGVVDSSETLQFIARNSTGSTIAKTKLVYISGATGQRPNITLADASLEVSSSKTIGITRSAISNNADGYIITHGTIHDINTSAFADGNALWLSETAGEITNVIPNEPAHSVFIGYVAYAHPTQGRIILHIQNGYELNELHGVKITSETDKDTIYYNNSTGLWENATIHEVLGYTTENVANKENLTLDNSATKYPTNNLVKTALNNKENLITAGTTAQYFRGDKTFQTLDKNAVGLSNIDNTSDVNKPISTATQTALNLKENSLGFTPENVTNKQTDLTASATKYPTVDAVNTGLATKQNTLGFTTENVANKSTNTSLGTSNTLYPTQNAVKVYADSLLGNANALVYKGVIDCSTNPNYPSGDAGFLYVASVAGKIGGASGIDVEVGDIIICNTDGTVSDNQATVGQYWNVIQKNIVGAVTGPASSVSNNVVFFDGTTGKIIKDSGLTLSGSNTGDETTATIKTKLGFSDVTSLQTSLDAKANIASPTFTGTVTSPAVVLSSETASTIASFDASKNIKSLSTATYPSLTELSYGKGVTSGIQTQLDAKSPLNPRVQTVTSSATVTPVSTGDLVIITAQATGLTLANPTGTFVEGQALMIRIKDNGTARTIAFGTNYRAIGITLPSTTVISKTMYLGIIYNSTDAKWDIVGLNQQA